jgi:hypothetical protein
MQIAADKKNEQKRLLELATQEFKEPEAPKISALESIAKVCKKLGMDNEYRLAMEAKKYEEAQLIDVAREISEAVQPVSTIHHWGDDVMVNLDASANGLSLRLLADTGARPSVINLNTLHRLGISEQTIEPTFYQARAANSGLVDLVGQITIPILFSISIATVTGLNYEWTDILRDPEFEF